MVARRPADAGRKKRDHVVNGEGNEKQRKAKNKHTTRLLFQSRTEIFSTPYWKRWIFNLAKKSGEGATAYRVPSPGSFMRAAATRRAGRGDAFLSFSLLGQHLAAAIHAGLEIDVVRPAQFAGILVFDISRTLQRVRRPTHAASRRGSLFLRHGHGERLLVGRRYSGVGGLIEEDVSERQNGFDD